MIRRMFFILLSLTLVIVILTAGVGCSSKKKEGEVPTYKTGDKWVYSTTIDGVDYAVTISVTGTETVNDINCYKFDSVYEPSVYEVYSTAEAWAARSEPYFDAVKMNIKGTYKNMPASVEVENSVEYPDGSPWPLEVGKEFRLTEVTETTSLAEGETDNETETETTTWKVVSKEEVTVTAGKFTCFKIEKYNEDGELMDTWWYSDEVKNDVKDIDAKTGEVNELKSYSLS